MNAPNVYLVNPAPAELDDAELPPYALLLGLVSNPFPVTPDETHYFFTPEIEATYEEVSHFIEMRKGFLLLTGDVGLGKTTLLRRLLASFDKTRCNTALILTSFLDQSELLETVAADFGLRLPPGARRIDHLAALNEFLLAESAKGKINVLFIDDAQALDALALDVVRQLSNLETAQSKLIQVVLCGQPELLDTLNQHSLRQVKSRIALHRQLRPLDPVQTGAYIAHRLAMAGAVHSVTITADGLQALHDCTCGSPRRIHHLMDRCLYGLLANGTDRVDEALVQMAWQDLGWPPPTPHADLAHGNGASVTTLPNGAEAGAPSWYHHHVALFVAVLLGSGLMLLGGSIALGDYRSTARVVAEPVAVTPMAVSPPEPPAATVAKPIESPVVGPIFAHIPEPANWVAIRAALTGLDELQWPKAESVPMLTEQLQQALQGKLWQAVPLTGEPATPCSERPVLSLNDARGQAWRLSFIEAQWPTAPIAMGLSSAPVRQLQQFLTAQGWLGPDEVDAMMGPRTAYALAHFQREQGLAGTGQFSPATAYRLSCRMSRGIPMAKGAVND
jgi:general secretion pathway protein A